MASPGVLGPPSWGKLVPMKVLPRPHPYPALWTLSCSTEGGAVTITALPGISQWTGPKGEPSQAPPLTPRRLIFWAAVLVVLAGFRGGLISGRAGDPGNGGQVPRGCFGHR